MAIKFTDENVNEIIESGKPVLIDCWGDLVWPVCENEPLIDEVAERCSAIKPPSENTISMSRMTSPLSIASCQSHYSYFQGWQIGGAPCRLTA